ncbi:DUF1801 domain-containing protein [Bowmanella dokdonensis]|uniref:DUF1801 domain-containing protein n=1 Tax=Bowmanella dokdonensis TaxID=751969 RepID=A0A939DJY1_9ALTE|nr:DUF1801 domain-containing protein [Bowmanella dokdonensis]MBN7823853.1 DUF1801 domain-containing protein [Bowmanella dokdonensis]
MNPEISASFEAYPQTAVRWLLWARELIYQEAAGRSLGLVQESLKWGEASYRVKGGTAIRLAWKAKRPRAIQIFFHCQTCLVDTFRELYPYEFEYQGNRAIVLPLDGPVNEQALRHCISLALQYHSLKHLPLLGA